MSIRVVALSSYSRATAIWDPWSIQCGRLNKPLYDSLCWTRLEASCFSAPGPERLSFRRAVHANTGAAAVKGGQFYRHNPFDLRNSHCRTPMLPIHELNLRLPGISGRGKCKRVRRNKFKRTRCRNPVFQKGKIPLYKRFPKWSAAIKSWRRKPLDWCNLQTIGRFLEKGRLDSRFPITQRHLHDSGIVRVRRGVHLYNVEDRPFPYRIHIEVAATDQSSVDAINQVGGSVTIVYRNFISLKAHVRPQEFEILPRTPRPNLNSIYALEKLRARGCLVQYIKPLWLLQEEEIMKRELLARRANSRRPPTIRTVDRGGRSRAESLEQLKERLLLHYRGRFTRKYREVVKQEYNEKLGAMISCGQR